MRYRITIFAILLIAPWACKEKYNPEIESSQSSYLVVEANIATGGGVSRVFLTRTSSLEDTSTKPTVEPNALVAVEGKDNTLEGLTNLGEGYYEGSGLNVVAGHEYRLHINVDGKGYVSDYVVAKIAPEIDSVGWVRESDGVQIQVSTHDPSAQTKRYKWDFVETWETHSKYESTYIYENGGVRLRNLPEEDVYTCWKNFNSTSILIGNSLAFTEDAIKERQINLILNGDQRLSVRYSILVRQYALDDGAYSFLELTKKNTEELGSIFSPQPSELKGNLHCLTNPSEYVVGYVTVSSVTEKRIYITAAEVPDFGFQWNCTSVILPNNPDTLSFYFNELNYSPYWKDPLPPGNISASQKTCVDCVFDGGSKTRPIFW